MGAASSMMFPGETVPLALQLWDGATTKFVRARIFDDTDTEIVGSPFALAHVADGLYTNNALAMPNLPHMSTIYRVFDDPGFTSPSTIHSDAWDLFLRDDFDVSKIDDIITTINNILNQGISTSGLEAFVNDDDDTSVIVQAEVISADVDEEDRVFGSVNEADSVIAETKDETLNTEVDC